MSVFGFFRRKRDPASLPDMGSDFPFKADPDAKVFSELPTEGMEKAEDPINEKPGLEVKFTAGERLPWKGIWFRIARVDKMQLTLVPESMTWKMAKKVQERKAAHE